MRRPSPFLSTLCLPLPRSSHSPTDLPSLDATQNSNLQRLPLPGDTQLEELTYEGHDISFYDDVDALPALFQTLNTDSAGELLVDFFRYWSKDFNYAHLVVSIRSDQGTVPKVHKGWHTDVRWLLALRPLPSLVECCVLTLGRGDAARAQFEFDPEVIVRDQHKLCIEVRLSLSLSLS